MNKNLASLHPILRLVCHSSISIQGARWRSLFLSNSRGKEGGRRLFRWDIGGEQMKPPDSFERVLASESGKARGFRLDSGRKCVSILVSVAALIGFLVCTQVQAQVRERTISGAVTS